MLMLTRRTGEKIVIGDEGDIVVTVLSVNGRQVKLGIDAPKQIAVHREEIKKRIDENKIGKRV